MSSIDKINVGGVDFDIGGTAGVFYDSYEEAVEDIDNIEDGTLVYTPEAEPSVQDVVDGMTALHLAGSQVGAGTKDFTFNTEAQKRMLCITKKSGVIVESKEIPVDVLDTDDVIPLGNSTPIVYTDDINPYPNYTTDSTKNGIKAAFNSYDSSSGNHVSDFYDEKNGLILTSIKSYGLATDSSNTTGATLTYNDNNSFTITVTDSTLSVYVYVDMLVLGGSASGRNVSFNAAGTSLQSTDVEGAIKEIAEAGAIKQIYKGSGTMTMAVNAAWSTTINFENPVDTDKTNVIITGWADGGYGGYYTFTLNANSLVINGDHVHNGYAHGGWYAYSVVEYK